MRAILVGYCTGCHNQRKARNGLVLDSYTGIMQGGSSGAAIVKGDANGSLLLQLITRKREPFMPYEEEKLPAGDLEIIRRWIEGGALQTKNDAAFVPSEPKTRTLDPNTLAQPRGAGALPEAIRTQPYWWTEKPTTVNTIAVSPFSPLIAVGGYRQVILFDANSFARIGVLNFPEGAIYVLRFSRDGTLLLAGGGRGAQSGRVVAWDVSSGERVLDIGEEPDIVLAADISEDHRFVALGGPDSIVRVYATKDGSLIHEIDKHTDWITAIAFSPDGVLLATADRAGGVYVWEALSGREFQTLPAHRGRVTDLAWRVDSASLVTVGDDATIRVINTESGREQRSWQSHGGVLSVDFDRTGRIATCGNDRISRLFDEHGAELRTFPALHDLATAIAVTHDGSKVVVGGWTGEVRVFDAANGQELAHLPSNPSTLWQEAVVSADMKVKRLSEELSRITASSNETAQQVDKLHAASTTAREQASSATEERDSYRPETARAEQAIAAARAVETELSATADVRKQRAARLQQDFEEASKTLAGARSEMNAAIEGAAVSEASVRRFEQKWRDAKVAAKQAPDDEALRQRVAGARIELDAATSEHKTAAKLKEGSIAIAERAALACARLQVALESANADLRAWLASVESDLKQAGSIRERAQATLDRFAELQIIADEMTTHARQATEALEAAEQAQADARDRAHRAEQALEEAKRVARSARAEWAQKRQAIVAAKGSVEKAIGAEPTGLHD